MATDTIVWITGASAGIGAALVRTVPYDDAHVIDISRSGGAPDTEHFAADLSEPAGWAGVEEHLVERLAGFSGSRVVFVHNAGTIDPIGFAGEVDSEQYRRNVLLNAAAPQVLGHAFLRAAAGLGCERHLVMLTSGAASSPYAGWSSYSAGKAAVDMWVRAVGEEQRRRGGVHVAAVAPGVVATAMQERIRAVDERDFPRVGKFVELHASGSLVDPADAARGIWKLLTRGLEPGAVVDLRSA